MSNHEKINYVEFQTRDIAASKAFFVAAFGWTFVDYGPDYAAISNSGIEGGIYTADGHSDSDSGGALVVLFSDRLEETRDKVLKAGGAIKKDIFSFPGGRRFHFTEPSGNELAVWSDK